MTVEDRGAVLLLEVRGNRRLVNGDRQVLEQRLADARLVLENLSGSARWSPTTGSGVSGTLVLEDSGEAFPLLHRIRTDLRADPEQAAVSVACGLGWGDEVEGAKLATQAFTQLGKKRGRLTDARVGGDDNEIVLGALCRTLDVLHSGWTRAQWEAVHLRDRGATLQEIGRELGIAYQNVSKRLIAARYSLYCEVLKASGLLFSKGPGIEV